MLTKALAAKQTEARFARKRRESGEKARGKPSHGAGATMSTVSGGRQS
jgi:hypothetical protein